MGETIREKSSELLYAAIMKLHSYYVAAKTFAVEEGTAEQLLVRLQSDANVGNQVIEPFER